MAPISGSSHTFQKLKLDTSASPKPAASTFASIPRHDAHQNGALPSHSAAELADPDRSHYAHGIPIKWEENGANGHRAYNSAYHGPAVAVGSSEGEDDIEEQFRRRTKSISFNNEVTLDSGNRLSIEEPLPKPAPRLSQPETSDGEELSDHEYFELPVRQRNGLQHRLGEPRYPLLQTTVDELATDPEYNDHVASLTSETTASPLEEARTPLETPTEYLLSPLPTTSPVEFPPYYGRRNGSQRSRSYRLENGDGEGSLRRASRRSSARSGRSMSSMSPAASFLSRYKATDGPLKPTEPDDEGQGIGYHGEYIIGKQIGYGGFSVVKEVTSIEDGRRVVNAVKIVRKQLKDKSELENEQIQTQFDHEVEIWRFLRHSYILPLLRVYTTDFATYCITKLNQGGTLFDLVRDLRKKKKHGLPERLAKRYTYQLASAMRYLHNDVQVVHRDIKLENCLVDMTSPNAEVEGGDLLLCDFGMADFTVSDQRDGPEPHSVGANQNIGPAETSTCLAGSLQYAAPELFNAPGPVFSPAADIWAFGVVVYALLTANLPFNGGLDPKTSLKIQSGEYDVDLIRKADAVQNGRVEDAIALVKGCLEMEPEKRWTVHDILRCRWLDGCMQLYEHVSRPWLADS
ncbi:kinase-like protein [Trematosphaeria pertusa]|uniref:Kinase-like protein n=1 Tax=Trematosphaeria pertusa TaxID=390896 RepID=A0A6A6IQY6_9PLEO|nr:kinase-like protein [Trematosphaeria pertusa]KAF2252000.1 kinase-like protein [Trematosphaeria pertusa]